MRTHVFWDLQTWKHGHLCTSQRKRRRTCEYNFSSLWLDLQCNFLRSIPSICSEPATIALNLAETFHPCYHVGCCFAAACTVVQLSNHSRRWCWERQQVFCIQKCQSKGNGTRRSIMLGTGLPFPLNTKRYRKLVSFTKTTSHQWRIQWQS